MPYTLRQLFTDRNGELSPLRLVFPLAVLMCCAIAALHGAVEHADTPSYLVAGDKFLHGEIDALRTPIYPLIAAAFRSFLGENYGYGVVALQYVAFMGSIVVFDRVLCLLRLSWGVRLLTLAAYALYPGYIGVMGIVLTEGLSLVGVVVMTHAMLRLIKQERTTIGTVLYFATAMVLLVLLRPGFIHLPVTMVAMGLIMACSRRWRGAAARLLLSGGVA